MLFRSLFLLLIIAWCGEVALISGVTYWATMGHGSSIPEPPPPPAIEEDSVVNVHIFTIVVTLTSAASFLFILLCASICCCPEHLQNYCEIFEHFLCYSCRSRQYREPPNLPPVQFLQEYYGAAPRLVLRKSQCTSSDAPYRENTCRIPMGHDKQDLRRERPSSAPPPADDDDNFSSYYIRGLY